MRARSHLLNAIPNALWTTLLVTPVFVFCYRYVSRAQLYSFLLAGALVSVLPKTAMATVQLSAHPAVYRRLRVPLLLRLTQDAAWLHRMGGAERLRVRRDRAAIARLVKDTWARERFHIGCFVFSALCTALACWQARLIWATALTAANILYNVYPVWLQQYLRLRLHRVDRQARGR